MPRAKAVVVKSGEDLHPGQQEIFDDPTRFRVIDCGRKWGKSSLCRALIVDGVSKNRIVAYMCPTFNMLSEMWRMIKAILGPIITEKNETEHRLETQNGSIVRFFSLDNPDGPRPFEFDLIIVDEAALVNLRSIWGSVLKPTLMKRHGRAVFASTPRGFDGFWELWLKGQPENSEDTPREEDWKSWKKPSWENPYLDPLEIERDRRTTPVYIFDQEYRAEFVSDSGAVFRHIEMIATASIQKEAIEGHSYVIGVDLAKSKDFSVFAVFDLTIMALVYLDRANHVDYTLQKGRLIALAQKFRALAVVVEENVNQAFMEQLRRTSLPIIPFFTGPSTKPLLIEGLAGAFDNEGLHVIPDSQLILELNSFSMERLPGGGFRYAAAGGGNDDCVMALALSFHGATYGVPTWKPELVEIAPTETQNVTVFNLEDHEVPWPTAEWTWQ